jgi:hypothetical protein
MESWQDIQIAATVYRMTQTVQKIRWLPIPAAEATLSPSESEKSSAYGTRQRPIRITDDLWDDFGVVADAIGKDRSALIRDFVRWSVYDETVKAPRRPDIRPEGLRYIAPLPAEIFSVAEGEIRPAAKTRTRFIIRVDADSQAVFKALIDAQADKGATYLDSSPIQISTLDRAHALLILDALTNAGLTVVKP